MARAWEGDRGGLAEIQEAIDLSMEEGQGRRAAVYMNNLGIVIGSYDGPEAALRVLDTGRRFVRERGLREVGLALEVTRLEPLADAGMLDEAARSAVAMLDALRSAGFMYEATQVHGVLARVLPLTGESATLPDVISSLREAHVLAVNPVDLIQTLSGVAIAGAVLGDVASTADSLERLLATVDLRDIEGYAVRLPSLVRAAIRVGRRDLALRIADGFEARTPLGDHARAAGRAANAEAAGDLELAADAYDDVLQRWDAFGVLPELGLAALGRGRVLVSMDRRDQAAEPLGRAREIAARCGMRPCAREAEQLSA